MTINEYKDYACDICESTDAEEIPCAKSYTNEQPLHVCRNCGLVYVVKRRTAKEIADDWSSRLFKEEGLFDTGSYSARIPAIKARQVFIADTIDTEIGLKDKKLCDIGAGEGQFLEIAQKEYGADVFGIEPSAELCEKLTSSGFNNFCGAIEDYIDSDKFKDNKFDVVTIMWTLECSSNSKLMLKAAHDILKPGGHVVIGTGSRILVPFKKPLQFYLDPKPLDTHNLRFSKNTLNALLATCFFKTQYINRYIDQDWLCMIASKEDTNKKIEWEKDNYQEVIDFFNRWDKETQSHYPEYIDE